MRAREQVLAGCLLLATVLGLGGGCGGTPPETQRNAELRQALRADPAYQLIPAGVRSSLTELEPHSSGFNGPEVGFNGFDGTEPAPPDLDASALLKTWDGRLRQAGWSPAAGWCIEPVDPARRQVQGVWSKQVSGRWAFFSFVVNGPQIAYTMLIRAVADGEGANPNQFGLAQPGPVGCAG